MLKIILLLLSVNLQTIFAWSREQICSMRADPGKCARKENERWFFNQTKNTCERFVYSGCGGNPNSFGTEKECLGTCGNICRDKDFTGICDERTPRYYFNYWNGMCQRYLYGGCGGPNTFFSMNECRAVCLNECTLPRETGLCRGMMPRYYYNAATETCERFIYGGCGGNANNFANMMECKERCHRRFSLRRLIYS